MYRLYRLLPIDRGFDRTIHSRSVYVGRNLIRNMSLPQRVGGPLVLVQRLVQFNELRHCLLQFVALRLWCTCSACVVAPRLCFYLETEFKRVAQRIVMPLGIIHESWTATDTTVILTSSCYNEAVICTCIHVNVQITSTLLLVNVQDDSIANVHVWARVSAANDNAI